MTHDDDAGDRRHRRWVLLVLIAGLSPVVGLGVHELRQSRIAAAESDRLRGEVRRAMERGDRMRAENARGQRLNELLRNEGNLSPDDADDLRRLRAVGGVGSATQPGGGPVADAP